MDRGKRLSRGNIIGKKGEMAFEQWALDNQLSPNKADTDLGVDYFCQIMRAVSGSKSLEGAGSILAAQVKTVEDSERPRLVLNRIDATDLLRQTQTTCLFGLCLADGSVHFQFLTKNFIDLLTEFLEGERKELTIPYRQMSSDGAHFAKLLGKYSNPYEQLQLRIHLVTRRVRNAIVGAKLSVQSYEEGTVLQVFVPWEASAFTVESSLRDSVRLRVLRGGGISSDVAGVQLHPVIMEALNDMGGASLNVTSVAEEIVNVGIQYQGVTATERFSRYRYESEIAYVHRAGLRLTYDTQPTRIDEAYVHRLECEIFEPLHRVPLKGKVLVFFGLFRPGAILSLRPDLSLPLASFGDSLEHLGEAMGPIPHLCKALGLSLSRCALPDLKDEEFVRSAWFLEALLLKGIDIGRMVRGFVLGPAADLPIEQVPTSPISISVPVVLNWKDRGITVWIECDGVAFMHGDLICGVQFTRQRSWKIAKGQRHSKSKAPEMWISREWPAIPIGDSLSGTHTLSLEPCNSRSLEAVIISVKDVT